MLLRCMAYLSSADVIYEVGFSSWNVWFVIGIYSRVKILVWGDKIKIQGWKKKIGKYKWI